PPTCSIDGEMKPLPPRETYRASGMATLTQVVERTFDFIQIDPAHGPHGPGCKNLARPIAAVSRQRAVRERHRLEPASSRQFTRPIGQKTIKQAVVAVLGQIDSAR